MAARLNPRNAASVRDRIKVLQLITKLQNHVLRKAKLEDSQVRAARFLIEQAIGKAPAEVNVDVTVEESNPRKLSDEDLAMRLLKLDKQLADLDKKAVKQAAKKAPQ